MAKVSGGNKIGEYLKAIALGLQKAKQVDVGFMEGSTYPDGTSVPMVAAVQEYGAPRAGIPPRPYFRNMIAAKSPAWPQATATLLKANHYNAKRTLEQVGAAIKGQLQQSITDTNTPALSPVTLMVRQLIGPNGKASFHIVQEARARVAAGESAQGVSTKPLVWTGTLQNAVSYRVK